MTEQPQSAQPPKERTFWQLDGSEQRVAFATFVGGFASIVVAAVIVGGAIVLARNIKDVGGLVEWGLGTILVLLGLGLVVYGWRPKYRAHPWFKRVAVVVGVLIASFTLLVWIGLAARIK